jgi:hypothetical protein
MAGNAGVTGIVPGSWIGVPMDGSGFHAHVGEHEAKSNHTENGRIDSVVEKAGRRAKRWLGMASHSWEQSTPHAFEVKGLCSSREWGPIA